MSTRTHRKLRLSFSPATRWRSLFGREKRLKRTPLETREKVLRRDDYSCVYCGFKSRTGLHIHHVDRDPTNNRLSNLETVCAMCHLILHAGFASQVVGILDFYAKSKYSQSEIIRLTRKLRARGMGDAKIRSVIGLHDRREFAPDSQYLMQLNGFVTSRLAAKAQIQRALTKMYEQERSGQYRSRTQVRSG